MRKTTRSRVTRRISATAASTAVARATSSFVCQNCGAVHSKWTGRCSDCGEWNSITEEAPAESAPKGLGGGKGRKIEFVPLDGPSVQARRLPVGIAEFDRVEEGDIIVIPFSDVGWTPLFARAGAVVAESGGMLSHSSIVSREYGIPCVVSVSGAMSIPDGSMAVVDGYRGIVTLQEDQ